MASPHPIKIAVENPEELLNVGLFDSGALIEIQSATTELGSYSALTGTGSTPTIPIVAGTRSYTGYDPNGDWSTWYRLRYRNAASTRLSVDWTGDSLWYTRPGHAPFQTGDEQAGQLCSLYDVKQRMGLVAANTDHDEDILEFIRQVTTEIIGYTGRQFVPDPSSGTKTYRVHTRAGYSLRLPKGIRSVTSLGVATADQPESGGSYTVATAGTYFLDPPTFERDYGWPATRLCFISTAGTRFYDASYGAEITGAFGWSAVPADIQGLAASAVTKRFLGKETGTTAIALGPDGGVRLLRDISPAEREQLNWYRSLVMA